MTDRDEFAKAALIGFTSSLEGGTYDLDLAAKQAYEIADAMLRQREKRQVSSQENLTLTDEERPLGDPEIAVEILRLRVAELEEAIRRLADQDATLSVQSGNVIVEMDATPTLTDAERECLEEAIYRVAEHDNEPDGWKSYAADTLRGLLERLKEVSGETRP